VLGTRGSNCSSHGDHGRPCESCWRSARSGQRTVYARRYRFVAIIAAHLALLAQRPLQRNDGDTRWHRVSQCGACYDAPCGSARGRSDLGIKPCARACSRDATVWTPTWRRCYGTVLRRLTPLSIVASRSKTIRDDSSRVPTWRPGFTPRSTVGGGIHAPKRVTATISASTCLGRFSSWSCSTASYAARRMLRQSRHHRVARPCDLRERVRGEWRAAHRRHLVHRT